MVAGWSGLGKRPQRTDPTIVSSWALESFHECQESDFIFSFWVCFFCNSKNPCSTSAEQTTTSAGLCKQGSRLTSSLDISKAQQNGEKNCESLFTLYPSGLNHHSFWRIFQKKSKFMLSKLWDFDLKFCLRFCKLIRHLFTIVRFRTKNCPE